MRCIGHHRSGLAHRTCSDISVTSFALSHIITAADIGGMVCVDDQDLVDRCLSSDAGVGVLRSSSTFPRREAARASSQKSMTLQELGSATSIPVPCDLSAEAAGVVGMGGMSHTTPCDDVRLAEVTLRSMARNEVVRMMITIAGRRDGSRGRAVHVSAGEEVEVDSTTSIDSSGGEASQLGELGFYVLAGAPKSPAELLDEVPTAESLGLGNAFISERFNIKEAVTLSGAVGAASRRLGIATAATNHNTRHPAVTAAYATTMHRLTGGRFALGLGLGRGIEPFFDAFGIPRITTAQIEDFVQLLRRLFRGELVVGHDGPAGKFPVLHLDSSFDEDIPIGVVAFGPNALSLAGRAMDMVVLHTYFTDETVERS